MSSFSPDFFANLNKFMNEKSLYISHLPESFSVMGLYKEFPILYSKFTKHNEINYGDTPRLWSFILNCKQVLEDGIEGDFAEVGVWRGNTASILSHYASVFGRKVYLFDTFNGFNKEDLVGLDADKPLQFEDTSIELVMSVIGEYKDHCEFIKGYFPDTTKQLHDSNQFSIVSLDADLYEPTKAGLEYFYPRLNLGGAMFLHDYSTQYWKGCKKAIDDFCAEHNEHLILIPDKYGSAFFRKSHH